MCTGKEGGGLTVAKKNRPTSSACRRVRRKDTRNILLEFLPLLSGDEGARGKPHFSDGYLATFVPPPPLSPHEKQFLPRKTIWRAAMNSARRATRIFENDRYFVSVFWKLHKGSLSEEERERETPRTLRENGNLPPSGSETRMLFVLSSIRISRAA